ncbi:hypothetical protein [Halegenticoccus soli]|uniref:hypothetical protein n=1 Tax=Halegenticoccus soli TaxID=1985678 RepID=UPI0018ECBEB9|nr:hypothetical protein [Halegenticoccus soli]
MVAYAFSISNLTNSRSEFPIGRHEGDAVVLCGFDHDREEWSLTSQFYGFTKRGVEILHDYKYLRGLPVARALDENTRKTEKIERQESAPRPELPAAVAEALEFEEPERDAVDVGTTG